MQIGYPMLVEAMAIAGSKGVISIDATDVFVDRPPGSEVYFDYAHVNHVANELVARRMVDAIFGDDASSQRIQASSE